MNGENDNERSRYDAWHFRGIGGDSDLNILVRMLDGLGVDDPYAVAVCMLERFGSFSGVFAATEAELEAIGVSSRVASFFNFVNPTFRRIAAGSGTNENITDEQTAVRNALTLIGRRNKLGNYAIYTDGVGRKICSEFLGEESAVSAAAIGACRHKTRKLLLVRTRADGEVKTPSAHLADALIGLLRLLEILDIKFIDYIETDGAQFFSLRRTDATTDNIPSVFDADSTPYADFDFSKALDMYGAKKKV